MSLTILVPLLVAVVALVVYLAVPRLAAPALWAWVLGLFFTLAMYAHHVVTLP
jgi:hypothetical protein